MLHSPVQGDSGEGQHLQIAQQDEHVLALRGVVARETGGVEQRVDQVQQQIIRVAVDVHHVRRGLRVHAGAVVACELLPKGVQMHQDPSKETDEERCTPELHTGSARAQPPPPTHTPLTRPQAQHVTHARKKVCVCRQLPVR